MVYSQCDEASAWAAQIARQHGLVCYDPQIGTLRFQPSKLAVPPGYAWCWPAATIRPWPWRGGERAVS